ncbi:MAG: T9SS type A sorting domain-containing protein [Bacteroidetes bacterium]|nr:T9SS type A sorting domain-containing protein [Bacteroidota bacterium]
MSFQGDHNQIIAYREIFSTYIWDHGFWLDFDDERYVCFKLKNADGEYNYGWIRCQMNKEDVTLTIKDYGYEEQINTAILTGSKESYVDIQNTDQQSNLFLTYQNSVLKIEMNANYFQPYLLSVYALNGNIIFQENVVEQSYEKYMDLPVGLHLIKIQQGDKNYFYKIIDLN